MPSAALPRVLTIQGARRLGITRSRIRTELRNERWRQLASGVFVTDRSDPTRDDWIHVGMTLTGERGILTAWDAVRLRGIGAPVPPSPLVTILTTHGGHRVVGGVRLRPSSREVRATRLSVLHPTLPEVAVVAAGRAIADTALQYQRLAPVRALVTSGIQRGLCTPSQLGAEYAAGPRNGSYFLRRAIEDVLAGAQSIAEAEAVDALVAIGAPPFEVNAPICGPAGRVLFRADLMWPQLRAIVEIDSREFHFAEDDWKATMARHNALTRLGFAVTHYPPSAIRTNPSGWALEVLDWLNQRARALAA